jgi:hypothetical protein
MASWKLKLLVWNCDGNFQGQLHYATLNEEEVFILFCVRYEFDSHVFKQWLHSHCVV